MVTNNYIRLTPDVQSMQGSLWNSVVRMIHTVIYLSWRKKRKSRHERIMFLYFLVSNLAIPLHNIDEKEIHSLTSAAIALGTIIYAINNPGFKFDKT